MAGPTTRRIRLAGTISIAALAACFTASAGTLREPLPDVLTASSPGELIPVTIVLAEQADPAEIAHLAGHALDGSERRRRVTARLKRLARSTQRGVLSALAAGRAAGQVTADVRPLWIGNVIGARATREVIEAIAGRSDVLHVGHNPPADVFLGGGAASCERVWPASVHAPGLTGLAPATTTSGPCPPGSTIECGVALLRAPEIWDEFGVTGDGVVVAHIDTGICYDHPDIAGQIWINPGEDLDGDGVVMDPDDENGVDDDANGYVDDLIGWDFFQSPDNDPKDTTSHGSHVAGTIAGDGTSGTCAGMAPGARLMVLRAGETFSDEVQVWDAIQYAVDNGADLMSMSLGWLHGVGPDRAMWRQLIDNATAAGTTAIVAIGNEGSGKAPDNARTPGDVPASITVGATDCADVPTGWSSRGPVSWQDVPPYNDHPYPPGLLKPDIAAPGDQTESHDLCSGYSLKSGTSMATPHVSGAAALLLQADPALSRDDLLDAFVSTAFDTWSPGADFVSGAGRIDAYDAYRWVVGRLRYDSHRLVDAGVDAGNGDGSLDEGEVVTLPVTLVNRDAASRNGVHAFLRSTTPGMTVLDGYAEWPAILAGGTAESSAPHFTIRADAACGTTGRFELDVRSDGHPPATSVFTARVGTGEPVVWFDDDFESDQGWTTASTASSGAWVREDPHGTFVGPDPAQPEDDTTPAPGSQCWVTGNPPSGGAGSGDIDSGTVTLTSPVIDASDADEFTLGLHRWFGRLQPKANDISSMVLSVSGDGGAGWVELESLDENENVWTWRTFDLLEFVAPSAQLQVRVEVTEDLLFPTIGPETILEALVDDVRISGRRTVCEPFVPPSLQPPNPVGDTLRASAAAGHVVLDWTEPPDDAGHDRATLYRVGRSADPQAAFAEIGTPTEPRFVDADAAGGGLTEYYRVVAENSGGAE